MVKQEKTVHGKRRRGRPPGKKYRETIPVRLTPELMAAVDRWAGNKDASRSEAIRALIERGLKK
jgi:hypothetical protein